MKKIQRRSDCPISYALDFMGDKWSFLIIRDLMFKGKHYYSEFIQSEEKIATNILADRLNTLEQAGIIQKSKDPEHGSKKIYWLTEKGIDLLPSLMEIISWSAKYDAHTAASKEFVKRVRTDRGNLIKELSVELKSHL